MPHSWQTPNTMNRYDFSHNVLGEKEDRKGEMSMIHEKVTQ